MANQYINLYTGKNLQGKKSSFSLPPNDSSSSPPVFTHNSPVNSLELSPGVETTLYDDTGRDYIYRSENAYRKINLPRTVHISKCRLRGLNPRVSIYRGSNTTQGKPFTVYGPLEVPKIKGSPFEKLFSGDITVVQHRPCDVIFHDRPNFASQGQSLSNLTGQNGQNVASLNSSNYKSVKVIPHSDGSPSYQDLSGNYQPSYPRSGNYQVVTEATPVTAGTPLEVQNALRAIQQQTGLTPTGSTPVGQQPVNQPANYTWLWIIIIAIIILLLIAIFAASKRRTY